MIAERRAGPVESDVVAVEGDIAGLQRDAVTAGVVHREPSNLWSPKEPGANSSPASPLASISTTGAPPRTYPGADAPLMVTFLDTAGSGLDRMIVPRTANLMSAGRPVRLRLALLIAAE